MFIDTKRNAEPLTVSWCPDRKAAVESLLAISKRPLVCGWCGNSERLNEDLLNSPRAAPLLFMLHTRSSSLQIILQIYPLANHENLIPNSNAVSLMASQQKGRFMPGGAGEHSQASWSAHDARLCSPILFIRVQFDCLNSVAWLWCYFRQDIFKCGPYKQGINEKIGKKSYYLSEQSHTRFLRYIFNSKIIIVQFC